MAIAEYLNKLLNFYTHVSRFPLARIVMPDKNLRTVYASFKNELLPLEGNLGFNPGKSCYITYARAQKNIDTLIEVLSDEYRDLLMTVIISKNKCKIIAYDAFGEVVLKRKIKFMSINLF